MGLLKDLLWWKVSERDLKLQVDNYRTYNIFHSARGASSLCLLLAVIVTILFMAFGGLGIGAFADILVSLILALFIYLGHRWAMLAAMLFWTFEKGYIMYAAFLGNYTPIQFWISLVWWAIYMHFFWLAFKVEIERRKAAIVTDVKDSLQEEDESQSKHDLRSTVQKRKVMGHVSVKGHKKETY